MASIQDLRRCKFWTEVLIGLMIFRVGYSRKSNDELDIHVIYIFGYDDNTNFLELLSDYIVDQIETKINEERQK